MRTPTLEEERDYKALLDKQVQNLNSFIKHYKLLQELQSVGIAFLATGLPASTWIFWGQVGLLLFIWAVAGSLAGLFMWYKTNIKQQTKEAFFEIAHTSTVHFHKFGVENLKGYEEVVNVYKNTLYQTAPTIIPIVLFLTISITATIFLVYTIQNINPKLAQAPIESIRKNKKDLSLEFDSLQREREKDSLDKIKKEIALNRNVPPLTKFNPKESTSYSRPYHSLVRDDKKTSFVYITNPEPILNDLLIKMKEVKVIMDKYEPPIKNDFLSQYQTIMRFLEEAKKSRKLLVFTIEEVDWLREETGATPFQYPFLRDKLWKQLKVQ